MARPRNGRYEENTSCRERETLYDQPRREHRNRDDRSYDRRDDWTRPHDGDHPGPDGRGRQESGQPRSRHEPSSRGSRDDVFIVYDSGRESHGSESHRRPGRGGGSGAQRSTASGNTATSGESQTIEEISQGRASSEWGGINPVCEGPIAGWTEMLRDERIAHLGELAAKEQAIRARHILRLVLKLLCFR